MYCPDILRRLQKFDQSSTYNSTLLHVMSNRTGQIFFGLLRISGLE